jgi:hypothetical protein
MAYPRQALAFALLLAGCPAGEQNDSETESSTGSTPTTMPTGGGEEGPCPGGGLPCDGECVFFGSDENNCGGCGNVCAAGTECIGAQCVDINPCDEGGGGGTPCGGSCVDIDNDPMHCGDCFDQCGEGEDCQGGMCIPTGDDNTTEPPPDTDTSSDPTTGDPTTGDPTSGGSSTGGSSTGV